MAPRLTRLALACRLAMPTARTLILGLICQYFKTSRFVGCMLLYMLDQERPGCAPHRADTDTPTALAHFTSKTSDWYIQHEPCTPVTTRISYRSIRWHASSYCPDQTLRGRRTMKVARFVLGLKLFSVLGLVCAGVGCGSGADSSQAPVDDEARKIIVEQRKGAYRQGNGEHAARAKSKFDTQQHPNASRRSGP
jgi:hypothetical protein